MNTPAPTVPTAPPLTAQLDHLVVAARSLAEGVQWCEHVLGITPGAGGEHPLMGTHNRLFTLDSSAFPAAYLEIIAINSGADCARPAGEKRWFDLDSPSLQQRLSQTGPQLIHWVARTAQAPAGLQALAHLGLDGGELLQASRMTAQGLLAWKIAVRPDGQRLFDGALPTLIEWGEVHPADSMAPSGVTLQSLQVQHPRAAALRAACQAIGLTGFDVSEGLPHLSATLQTPRGQVTLASSGI